jgi:hypothetical protein
MTLFGVILELFVLNVARDCRSAGDGQCPELCEWDTASMLARAILESRVRGFLAALRAALRHDRLKKEKTIF